MADPAAVGTTVAAAEAVPAVGSRRRAAGWLAATLAGYVGLAVAAAVPTRWAFVAAAVVVAAVEAVGPRAAPIVGWLLGRVGAGVPARALLRGLLLVLLIARAGSARLALLSALVAGLVPALLAVRQGLSEVCRSLRQPPVLTRNLPLDVAVPSAPSGWVTAVGRVAAGLELPAVVGLAIAADGPAVAAVAGVAVTAMVVAVPTGLLAGHVDRLRRLDSRRLVADAVQRALGELRAEVLLYFAGTPASRYQLEMWLAPVERLRQTALVLVRDRAVLATLGPTSLPVLCAPYGSTLMALDLPGARLGLYVSNASGNIHLIRRRGLWSVFVGHGDSDKAASASPFSRVYDELWVAGPVGRERYLTADVGVAAERVIEVGRPQLADLPATPAGPTSPVTVLYAPTWEGWGDEEHHTSLGTIGPALVAALLERTGIRLLYRPHPLTGSRDRLVRRAHTEVVRLLRAAGAVGPEVAPPAVPTTSDGSDLLDRALTTGRRAWSRAAYQDQQAVWTAAYWSAAEADRHRLLLPPAPELFACFAATDLLISDVSSVTADFLATDRPYAVVNAAGLPSDEFRDRYSSAAGGAVIGPDLSGLNDALGTVLAGTDPTAAARRTVRRQLVGCDGDAAWQAAVDQLCITPPPHDAR